MKRHAGPKACGFHHARPIQEAGARRAGSISHGRSPLPTRPHLGWAHAHSFLDDRNALFHSGRAAAAQLQQGSTWPYLRPELEIIQDQLDDILLTVLGYGGHFHRYWDADAVYVFPGRAKVTERSRGARDLPERAAALGAVYLLKPFAPEQVLTAVAAAAGKR